ncbi:MAG: hypothetical protein LBL61_04710 [Elusimicrobiota bacterium]|jgi:hypothetical protein|nr:hypothetical protein [Elusimicrobiota bacterium]
MKNNKNFNCLKLKEYLQNKIYEETKRMSQKEVLAYINSVNIKNISPKATWK